jgi:hypothetical protein
MISRLVPFWELTKFTGSRDLSSSELRYGSMSSMQLVMRSPRKSLISQGPSDQVGGHTSKTLCFATAPSLLHRRRSKEFLRSRVKHAFYSADSHISGSRVTG